MYKLSRDLGLTVAELQEKMTVAEFTGWVAYYNLEQQETRRSVKGR